MVPFPNCARRVVAPAFGGPVRQHRTRMVVAPAWSPAVIATAVVRPLTATGVDESVVVPFPN